ncbi:MAG: helix-turn-helix domain-containing protein [Planctomycetales bacterium]|nr:helix-turn-helix domain-containing protein [Planctomycetales bacterium]
MEEIVAILSDLGERLSRIEQSLAQPSPTSQLRKEWFTVAEAAELLKKQPFTIREWCRLHRIHAKKRKCGRGRTTEWVISLVEIERYLNEGLLPVKF